MNRIFTPQILFAKQSQMLACSERMPPGWLTSSEATRLSSLGSERRRKEFIACRFALRYLLAQATGSNENFWKLDSELGQAPCLNKAHHQLEYAMDIKLSLSHSGEYVACAISSQDIGVDLEIFSKNYRQKNILEMAELVFSSSESKYLNAIDSEWERQLFFHQVWSLKESFFKRIGSGLDFSLIKKIECLRDFFLKSRR